MGITIIVRFPVIAADAPTRSREQAFRIINYNGVTKNKLQIN